MSHGHGYGWGRAGDAGRLTLADMRHSAATEAGKRDPLGNRLEAIVSDRGGWRKAGHNRMVYTRTDGRKAFRLIHTDVVSVLPNGRVLIQTGGWASMTTRRAISEAVTLLGVGGAYLAATPSTGYQKPVAGAWNYGNVWGGDKRGGKNTLMLMRYSEAGELQRLMIPFDGWVSFARKADGSIDPASMERDSEAAITEV